MPRGDKKFGSTRRGISPVYADKYNYDPAQMRPRGLEA